MRYRALEVYQALELYDCTFDGARHPCGSIWISRNGQIFMLPEPDLDAAGIAWFDADVLDDSFRDRWVGFSLSGMCARHP